jgi:diacylglycerol kinase (ATP)
MSKNSSNAAKRTNDDKPVVPFHGGSFLRRLTYAFHGLKVAIWEEHNFPVHAAVAGVAALGGWYVGFSVERWCIYLLCVAAALTAEMINTAIERLGRAITREYNPQVRDALDVASAAVLVMAVGAAGVAMLILGWPLAEMFWPS